MTRFAVAVFMAGAVVPLTVACGEAKPEDDTPTAIAAAVTTVPPTGIAVGEFGTMDGFRIFARQIVGAVRGQDTMFFADRLKTEPVTCDETNTPPGLGDPSCEFVGQTFDGFLYGHWRSEGGRGQVDGVSAAFRRLYDEAMPAASDEFGDGGVDVYAISPNGTTGAAAVTALIDRPADFAGTGPLRVVLSTSWVFEDGRWLMDSLLTAYVLAEDFLIPTEAVMPYYPNWEHVPASP